MSFVLGRLVDNITVNIGSAHKMVDSFGCKLHIDERKLEAVCPCKWLEHARNSNVQSMQGVRSVY